MLKRMVSFLLSLVLVTTLCGATYAVEDRASKTLSSYEVSCKAGSESGKLQFTYDVRAKSLADSVGIESIALYSSGGVYMTTILGSTENGLIKSNRLSCIGDYFHTAVSGNSYYAIITVFAEIDGEYDSKKVSTEVVTAP